MCWSRNTLPRSPGNTRSIPKPARTSRPKKLLAYWTACLEDLKAVTVCDPACGSGAFLIRAYDASTPTTRAVVHGLAGAGMPAAEVAKLEDAIPDLILNHNLLRRRPFASRRLRSRSSPCGFARRARTTSSPICRSTSSGATASSPTPPSIPRRSIGKRHFPTIFGNGGPGGFSCVIGNPPWERVKVQDREFFSLTDPTTAEAVNASDRKKRIAAMPTANPELHASYLAARDHAQRLLDYARDSGRYPLTGKGDVNLYMLFAELASTLVAPDGLAGLLVPSGIATDDTTKEFFSGLMDAKRLVSLYDFENKEGHFEDVDRRFKFTALVFRRRKPQDREGRLRFLRSRHGRNGPRPTSSGIFRSPRPTWRC